MDRLVLLLVPAIVVAAIVLTTWTLAIFGAFIGRLIGMA